ncbi:uncharacterized protein RNJ42_02300 [Nakaseomyces bracarensis]|uniref:uncharacterized protein n=1 Tax=Nakaseomyces bracarensis TaxID=273131 RepID=UPI003871CF42
MSDNKMNQDTALVDLEKALETTEDEVLIEKSSNEKKTISPRRLLFARILILCTWICMLISESSSYNLFKFSEGPTKSTDRFNEETLREVEAIILAEAIISAAAGVLFIPAIFGTMHYYRLFKRNPKGVRIVILLTAFYIFAGALLAMATKFPCMLLISKYPILCDWPFYLISVSWKSAYFYGLDQLISSNVVSKSEMV